MADVVQIKLIGFKELEAAFKDVGPKMSNKIASRGLKEGAEAIASLARSNVHVSNRDEPHIRDHIVTQVQPSDGTSLRVVKIGVDEEVAWRAHWLEFGTAASDKGHGHHPTKAYPFMRPAIDAGAEGAVGIMGDTLYVDLYETMMGYPLVRL